MRHTVMGHLGKDPCNACISLCIIHSNLTRVLWQGNMKVTSKQMRALALLHSPHGAKVSVRIW